MTDEMDTFSTEGKRRETVGVSHSDVDLRGFESQPPHFLTNPNQARRKSTYCLSSRRCCSLVSANGGRAIDATHLLP